MILLNSLPEEYHVVKNALQYTGVVPKLDLVIFGIKARELELNASKRNGSNLFVKGKTNRKNTGHHSEHSSSSGSKDKKKGKKDKSKARWKCYHCGKQGHIKKYCYDFIRKQKNEVSIAAENSNCVAEVLTVSSNVISNEWVMDSGCSFHTSPNKNQFENFSDNITGTVFMGNNNTCQVKGIGNINLKLHDGKIRCLSDVRYVPGLKSNLISLGTLDELGYCYKAEKGCMHVYKDKNLVLSGRKRNGLYVLDGFYYKTA